MSAAWLSVVRVLALLQIEEQGRDPWVVADELRDLAAVLSTGEFTEWDEWRHL